MSTNLQTFADLQPIGFADLQPIGFACGISSGTHG